MVITNGLFSTFLIDLGIQLGTYLVSAPLQTEKFYDLSGSATYIACFLNSLLNRSEAPNYNLHPRQIIATSLSLTWCVRLGAFLFYRVLKVGHDKRFEEIKTKPIKFGFVFFAQVVWVWLTALPVFIVNSNASTQIALQWSDVIGITIWGVGFIIEFLSDYQKNVFKNKHPSEFIKSGLWAWSRHPNYFGEVTLWSGMWILCARGFDSSWQWVSIISPIFGFSLIYFVSGVPILEQMADKRYGHTQAYQFYKARTSIFVLWPPKSTLRLEDFNDSPKVVTDDEKNTIDPGTK